MNENYYLLLQDLYLDGTWGVAGILPELDPVEFLKGELMNNVPESLEVTLMESSGQAKPDIVLSLFPMFSEKLRRIFDSAGVDNIQYFKARVKHPVLNYVDDGYYVVNVIGRVKAVDQAKSVMSPSRGRIPGRLKQFTVDSTLVKGHKLFRLYESPSLIVISEQLKIILEKAGLTGVQFLRTEDWTGVHGGH